MPAGVVAAVVDLVFGGVVAFEAALVNEAAVGVKAVDVGLAAVACQGLRWRWCRSGR